MAASPRGAFRGGDFILFAAETTLTGSASPGTDYRSEAFDITGAKRFMVAVFLEQVIAGADVTATVETSMDLTTWRDVTGFPALTMGGVTVAKLVELSRYVRLRINVEGADGAATLWARGTVLWT